MEKSLFNKTISNTVTPQQINITELEALVSTYPYFQSARALLLKIYYQKESYKYNHFLKSTAAHTTDRSILFEYITSKKFKQNDISFNLKQNINNLKLLELVDEEEVRNNLVEDNKIDHLIKETEGVLNPNLFAKKIDKQSTENLKHQIKNKATVTDKTENDLAEKIINDSTKENHKSNNGQTEQQTNLNQIQENAFTKSSENHHNITGNNSIDGENTKEDSVDLRPLQIGKPLEFNKNEQHSFSEWLKITAVKPVTRKEQQLKKDHHNKASLQEKNIINEVKEPINEKLAIIDKFLQNNPKIKPPSKTAPKPNIAEQNLNIEDSLMTETLARIYVEQHNFDKATQAYKILSLKYPEKSSFFAHQIFLIETLKEKNNT